MVCQEFLKSLAGLSIEEANIRLENKYPTIASRSIISLLSVDEESLGCEFIAVFLDSKDETIVNQAILYSPRK